MTDSKRPAGRIGHIWPEVLARRPSRVLELGPLDGRDTIPLARECETLITIEGRLENAITTQEATNGLNNVTVIQANLETYDLLELGRFDCVWASGILYHLPEPWTLVQKIGQITDLCVGWTHVATARNLSRGGYDGCDYKEHSSGLLAGLSPTSFWLTSPEFIRMWATYGFLCRFYEEPQPHQHGGLAGQFIAERRHDSVDRN